MGFEMTDKSKTTQIEVPNAPDIHGLVFRRFLGEGDIAAMVGIKNAANRADGIQEFESVEEFGTYYKNLRNTDMEKDIFIAEVDGEMIGFGRTSWKELEFENTFTYQNFFITAPDWREKGIGQAIQPVLESRMVEISQWHRGEAKKFMEALSWDSEGSKRKLLVWFDYEEVRYFFEMKRDLKDTIIDAELPAGLEIRPVSEGHLPAIHAGWYEAFEDHWAFIEAKEGDLERWTEQVMTIPAHDPKRWVVVWEGDEVAGMIFNSIHDETNKEFGINEGWLDTICVRRSWRKRGLASAMIVESMRRFKEWGLDVAALGVDSNNPTGALGLYERHGFKKLNKVTSWRKEIK
jgi:mycothiol synthase